MFTFTPDEVVYMLAHIDEDRSPVLIGVSCMLLVLCIAATSARFLARRITRAPLAADDYLVLTALVRYLWMKDLGDQGLLNDLLVSVYGSRNGVLLMYFSPCP